MRNAALSIALLVMVLAGCNRPFEAITDSRVAMYLLPAQDLGPLAEMPVAGHRAAAAKIALIDVDGLLLNEPMTGLGSLGENPVALFREKLDRVAADPSYRAIVLRINSPGGGVTASDIMWRDLRAFQARTGLPVVACLMDHGTGGAYYLATAADHIVAHPTTITGGMGVILNLYNLHDTMLQFNIFGVPVKAGELIDMGTPMEPPDDVSRAILQEIADEFHHRFREVVRQGRPEHDGSRAEDFDGRIFTARQALDLRLIDSIAYLDDAVEMARRLGDCPRARVVVLHRCPDRARSPYDVSPNTPLQTSVMPFSLPGLDRSQMPTFLYLWQPEPTIQRRVTGR